MRCRVLHSLSKAGGIIMLTGFFCGCAPSPPPPPPVFVPTDETAYVGSNACGSCHASVAATHVRSGHAQALKQITDGTPSYPAGPGVSAPPSGFNWTQISYVIGGYEKAATFVDLNGYLLTTGITGVNTQYNVAIPPLGTAAEFVPFLPNQTTPQPLDFNTLFRRTTGAQSLQDNGGRRQDNRPGILGTWAQAGVQCEACHGPGSLHVPNPSAGNIDLDTRSATCIACHSNADNSGVITATEGLIGPFQQATELAASPHEGFACTICHNPHASTVYDRSIAIINECQACHPTQNMGLHEGFVFRRGDYAEPLTCVSCHMPYAAKTGTAIDLPMTTGRTAHLGDTRSHIFRLNPAFNSLAEMFSADGTQIVRDAQGQASVSTCFVCQRCHTGDGNAFAFPPNEGCAFGVNIHAQ